MRERIEFRIPEEDARTVLMLDEGSLLGKSVRVIEVSRDDDRFKRIRDASSAYRARGDLLFTSWEIKRTYSTEELAAAAAFKLDITSMFEPAGEECGTRYRDEEGCRFCGAGGRQVGFLRLDLRRLPRSADIARSIADEWVVNQRLAELLIESGLTGIELAPVLHRSQPDELIDLESVPAGRRLLQAAEAEGIAPDSWEFWVWLNRDENDAAFEAARVESTAATARTEQGQRLPVWHQLVVTAPSVSVGEQTRFGINVFDEDRDGRFRCPLGHVAGLNVLSETFILRASQTRTDFAVTRELMGMREGLLRPTPLLLISQRARKLFEEHDVKGYRLEVAPLVDD